MNTWKKDLFNIPNLLSLFRLVLIPVYVYFYLNARSWSDYLTAGIILAISCITDMLDGKIARHFSMITPLGKLLDPIADKVTQLVLMLCMRLRYPMMRPVLLLFVTKELFQFFAALINYRQGKALDGALLPGKICTTVLFISFTILVILPDLNRKLVNLISILDFSCLMFAFISYIFAFFGKNAKVQDIGT